MVSRRGRGNLYQGSSTEGIHTALIGRVTTELEMNLKAMTLRPPSDRIYNQTLNITLGIFAAYMRKNQAKRVCTILKCDCED